MAYPCCFSLGGNLDPQKMFYSINYEPLFLSFLFLTYV